MDDQYFMKLALSLAQKAESLDEVPVGAVIVKNNIVIASSFNQKITKQDATEHAELSAIKIASQALNTWCLDDCTLYVTLEPCSMCAGAIIHARLNRLVFGAYDPKAGACGSVINIINHPSLNHRPLVTGGVLETECSEILKSFFRNKRKSTRNQQANLI